MGNNIGHEAPREGKKYEEERKWEENLRLLTGAAARGSVDKAIMQTVEERVKKETVKKTNEEKTKAKRWRDRCLRAEDELDALKKERNLRMTGAGEFWEQAKREEQIALHLAAQEIAAGTVSRSKGKQREGEPEKEPEVGVEEDGGEDGDIEKTGEGDENTAEIANKEEGNNKKKRPRTKKAAKGATEMATDTVGTRVAGRRRGLP